MAAYVKTRSHVGVRVAVLAVLIGLALMVQSLYPGAASIVPRSSLVSSACRYSASILKLRGE